MVITLSDKLRGVKEDSKYTVALNEVLSEISKCLHYTSVNDLCILHRKLVNGDCIVIDSYGAR